LVALFSRRGT